MAARHLRCLLSVFVLLTMTKQVTGMNCGLAVTTIYLACHNVESQLVHTDSSDSMSLAEIKQLLDDHGLATVGINVASDRETVEATLQRLRNPVIAHCVIGDQNNYHYILIVPTRGNYLIFDPLLENAMEVNSETMLKAGLTGNFLVAKDDAIALEALSALEYFKLAIVVFVSSVAIPFVINIAKRFRRSSCLARNASLACVMLSFASIFAGCAAKHEAAMANNIAPESSAKQTVEAPSVFALSISNSNFHVTNRSTDSLQVQLENLSTEPIYSKDISIAEACCTVFELRGIEGDVVMPGESISFDIGFKTLVELSGVSTWTLGVAVDREGELIVREANVTLHLPEAKAKLLNGAEWNVGYIKLSDLPRTERQNLVVETRPNELDPTKLTTGESQGNLRIEFEPGAMFPVEGGKAGGVPMTLELRDVMQAGFFRFVVPVIYDGEKVGDISATGELVEEWSLNGRNKASLAILRDSIYPRMISVVNADGKSFEILSCRLTESSICDVVADESRTKVVFNLRDNVPELNPSNQNPKLEVRVKIDAQEIPLEFDVSFMPLGVEQP